MTITDDNYLPAELAQTFPDQYSAEYWRRTAKGELAFQRCADCKTFRHPPGPICASCRSFESEWVTMTQPGTIYTYTIVTHSVHPALNDAVPFNVVLVEFPEAPAVRLITNLVGVEPADVRTGMKVDVVFERTPEMTLPRVKLAAS